MTRSELQDLLKDIPKKHHDKVVEFRGHLYATLDFEAPDSQTLGPQGLPELVPLPTGWEIVPDTCEIQHTVIGAHNWGTMALIVRTGEAYCTRLWGSNAGSKIGNFELLVEDGCYGPRRNLRTRPTRVCIRYPEGTEDLDPIYSQGRTPGVRLTSMLEAPAAMKAVEALSTAPVASAKGPAKVGFLFPGQGSQYVKMLSDVKDLPAVRGMLDQAEKILGYDLLALCLGGPEAALEETRHCQPAMFVGGLAALEKLRVEQPDAAASPGAVAGLSLGEYTALCAAGVLGFEDALRLVKIRGEAMQEAANASKQLMLSVVGLSTDKLENFCTQAKLKEGVSSTCQISNHLFPDGYTVGGTELAITTLKQLADAGGALQAKVLKTGGAFHTRLMQPAQDKLNQALEDVLPRMKPPTCAVYMNATGEAVAAGASPQVIVDNLKTQLTNPVLWQQCVTAMLKDEVADFYELGPQKQLTAMMKRIDAAAWKRTKNVQV